MQPSLPFKSCTAATFLLAALLCGCATSAAPEAVPASVARAELLLQQNNPAAAAQMYEQLARNNPPPERNDLTLAAARAWLAARQLDDAQRAVDAAGSGLTPPQQVERERLRNVLAMARGQSASAQQPVAQISAAGERAAPRAGGPPVATVAAASPIALLLPLTGRQALPSELIRDGFLAAVALLPEAARPQVRVYDTGTVAVAAALQTARNDGAGFVVGPLTREEVQAAAGQRPGNLPLLLLNNLAAGTTGANLYQYALAAEDEARQIARQMTAAGQREVMVLAQSGDWGTRVTAAFTDELARAGGHVLARGGYEPGGSDLAARVTAILGVDESRERHQKLQKITGGNFEFEPRPRPGIDAIFVAGNQGLDLRQINPLLHRYAEDTTAYMTQFGLVDSDAQANRDLAGMRVLDMPWMLEAAGPAAELRAATESTWGAHGLRDSRYFAFGFDAATLALAIRRGSTAPLAGLTGRLSLSPEGRVERSLNWARVNSEGAAQPADPTPR